MIKNILYKFYNQTYKNQNSKTPKRVPIKLIFNKNFSNKLGPGSFKYKKKSVKLYISIVGIR